MRGKASIHRHLCHHHRITPAYAGKSFRVFASTRDCEDHPRLCGEKCILFLSHQVYLGSPPPMRGKDVIVDPSAASFRITPAYAGKSYAFSSIRPI